MLSLQSLAKWRVLSTFNCIDSSILDSNASGNLWAVSDTNRISYVVGDTLQCKFDGHYYLNMNLSFQGNNNEMWLIRFVDATDPVSNTLLGFASHRKTSSNDTGNASVQLLEECSVDDKIIMSITNATDNDDPTIVSGTVVMNYMGD